MDEQHDVDGSGVDSEDDEEYLSLPPCAQRVLQLPVILVKEISNIKYDLGVTPLFAAASEWALLYRDQAGGGTLSVRGFDEKEQLSACLTDVYRTAEIVAVLNKGKPVRLNMRVSARIG